jgi:chemotaxis protein histidine kinase CheA
MGLSIVQEALSQMGGTITVTSRIGAGSTMTVEIPVGYSIAAPVTLCRSGI